MNIYAKEILDYKTPFFGDKFRKHFKDDKTLHNLALKTIKNYVHDTDNVEKIDLLLQCNEFDIHCALAWAVTFQKKELIDVFIKKNGNIFRGCNFVDFNSHIIDFCTEHQIEEKKILNALLKQTANKSRCFFGTFVDTEELTNYIDIFKSLKRNNMDINFKDKEGKTLVHYICDRQMDNNMHTQLLLYQTIIDFGFDLKISDFDGRTVFAKWKIFDQLINNVICIKNDTPTLTTSTTSNMVKLNDIEINDAPTLITSISSDMSSPVKSNNIAVIEGADNKGNKYILNIKCNTIKVICKNQNMPFSVNEVQLVNKINAVYILTDGKWDKSVLNLEVKAMVEYTQYDKPYSNFICHMYDNKFIRFSKDTLIYKDSDILMLGKIYTD